MEKYKLVIDVFDKEKLIDSFSYSLKDIHPVILPNKLPYQGMEIFISGSINHYLEFSPDGYELWIRFSKEHDGKCIYYLIDREYIFYFRIKEDNDLKEMVKNDKNVDPNDRIGEFENIKKFKNR